MMDDRLGERLEQAARDYHRPPATPREELWARIQAERARRRSAPRVVRLRPWFRWSLAAAAVLLVGVLIGRATVQRGAGVALRPTSAPAADLRPARHARSTLMQAMHLLLAAVTTFAQGRAPQAPRAADHPRAARVLTENLAEVQGLAELSGLQELQSLAGLQGLAGLEGLQSLQGLVGLQSMESLELLQGMQESLQWLPQNLELGAGLEGLGALEGLQDLQDPGDSLYRAARRAFNRSEYTTAADLYAQLIKRYPRSSYAGDAHYWAAFALFRTGDGSSLRQARTLLDTQERSYAQASTRRDGPQLYARIQTALAQQGDQDANIWVRDHAAAPRTPSAPRAPTAPTVPIAPIAGGAPTGRSCPSEDEEDDLRMQALTGLLQMNAEHAVPILKRVLLKRDACSAALRRKAVFLISQKRSDETEDVLLDIAQHDPDSDVRQQAVFWLSQVPTERAVALLDS